jgi:hypothetical protein
VRLALGLVVLTGLTALAAFVVEGVAYHSHLFYKIREFVRTAPLMDWLWLALVSMTSVLLLCALVGTGKLLSLLVLAKSWALALHFLLDQRVDQERQEPRQEAEHLLKSLRLRGVDEQALRLFVCKYAGDRWEEFFEALFGYRHLVEARQLAVRGSDGRRRPRYAAWRDPIIRWIDGRLRAHKERREKALLALVGQQDLQAHGVTGPGPVNNRSRRPRISYARPELSRKIRPGKRFKPGRRWPILHLPTGPSLHR